MSLPSGARVGRDKSWTRSPLCSVAMPSSAPIPQGQVPTLNAQRLRISAYSCDTTAQPKAGRVLAVGLGIGVNLGASGLIVIGRSTTAGFFLHSSSALVN